MAIECIRKSFRHALHLVTAHLHHQNQVAHALRTRDFWLAYTFLYTFRTARARVSHYHKDHGNGTLYVVQAVYSVFIMLCDDYVYMKYACLCHSKHSRRHGDIFVSPQFSHSTASRVPGQALRSPNSRTCLIYSRVSTNKTPCDYIDHKCTS